MKRKNRMVGIAALLLCAALAGCAAAPKPQSGAAAQVASQPTAQQDPKGQRVAVGQSVQADLDGDGKEETIAYQLQPENEEQPVAAFTVDGVDYAAQLPELEAWLYFPAEDAYYITDLDTTDGKKEIALMDRGPSDDPTTYFFRYEAQKLVCLGEVSDYISSDSFTMDGAGTVHASGRLNVLQTWQAIFTWKLEKDTLQQVCEASYTPCYYGGTAQTVTLIQNLKVYAAPDTASESTDWLPDEQPIAFLSTDNVEWVQLQRGKQTGWIHLMDFGTLDNNGLVNTDAVFNGLVFAD